MGCEIPTIKYSVFLFNTISAILGICVIVVNGLGLKNYGEEERMICIFMLVLGSLAFLISFVACCGAIRENICLTWTYAICMLGLIIGNSIIVFGYISHIDGETRAHKDIDHAWAQQLKEINAMARFQNTLYCCGVNNSYDYIKANLPLPSSCFVSGDFEKSTILFSGGCLKKLIVEYEAAEHWITIFAWSSLSVEMLAFIAACVLAATLSNQKRRTRY